MSSKDITVLYNRVKNIILTVPDLAIIVTWLITMSHKIVITTATVLATKFTTTIYAGITTITSSSTALINLVKTIYTGKFTIVATSKLFSKLTITMVYKNLITTSTKLYTKFTQTINVKSPVLTLTPSVGLFHMLSYYDPLVLSYLDTFTLADLDFTSS
jgi:hypothetical protein